MINYIEKGNGLHVAVDEAGHRLHEKDGVWESSDDVAVQAIIDAYDPMVDHTAAKIAELKSEGLSRINTVFPAINDFDELDLVREQWLSIAPAARSATTDFQTMIDIVQAGKAAATTIKALTTVADVNAYNVATDPLWP